MKIRAMIKQGAGLTIAFLMVLTLMACGGTSSDNGPKTVVKDFFQALKDGDVKTASSYLVESDDTLGDEKQEEMLKTLFENLTYEIQSSDVKEDTAVIKTKITTVDLGIVFQDILAEVMTKALEMAGNDEESSQQEIEQLFVDLLNEKTKDPDVEKVTNEVEIKLVKKENQWLIEGDDAFINAITGNLMEAMQGLGGM